MESRNNKHSYFYVRILLAVLMLPLSYPSSAATVPLDLLGGIGDMEYPAVAIVTDANTYRSSRDWPAPGRQIACGWWGFVRSFEQVRLGQNVFYDIVGGCKNASNGQSLSVCGIGAGTFAAIGTCFPVQPGRSRSIQPGDSVTFSLDHVKMTDFAGAPVTFKMRISWNHPTKHYGIYTDVTLPPSTIPFSRSVTAVVPSTDFVRAFVWIDVNGDLGQRRPTIIFDGARLTVTRNNKLVMEEVPVPRKRNIKTCCISWNPRIQDPAEVAANYDELVLQQDDQYALVARLKYYNPNIKVYLYQVAGTISDFRYVDANGNQQDSPVGNCPLGMRYVLETHEEWLYRDPYNPNDKYDLVKPPFIADKYYPGSYWVKVSNPTYQDKWFEAVLKKLTCGRFDGIFMDTLGLVDYIGRSESETQSFLHSVCPRLRAAGFETIQNAASVNLDSRAGRAYFDPWWSPSSDLANLGFLENQPNLTPDGLFNEYAFFYSTPRKTNVFAFKEYWLRCVRDQVAVGIWNTMLPKGLQKRVYSHCLAWDLPNEPAASVDGWGNFAICSYLLGQNEWTALSCDERERRWGPDFSKTLLIGTPSGPDLPVDPANPYCRYRVYVGNDQGAKGGVVVVNAGGKLQSITLPFDLVDETGRALPIGTSTKLKPHTGRLFYHRNNYKYVSVITSPRENEVVQGPRFRITGQVIANRPGLAIPKIVQIRINNGAWINCPVDVEGNWTFDWTPSSGRHTIHSRAFVRLNDFEPVKPARTFIFQIGNGVRNR